MRGGPHRSKQAASLQDAIAASGLTDGGTISFHHHLRDGDAVMAMVLDELAEMGFTDLHLAASSIFPVHADLPRHMDSGLITRLSTAYLAGPAADAVMAGRLRHPARLQTHGGRARAIQTGETAIDVAFIAAPAADDFGNLNGIDGPSACGPLGYPMVDAEHAAHVIAITDNLMAYPLRAIDIAQNRVDQVVTVPSIGDAAKIVSGTTRAVTDPASLAIAQAAARVIAASGYLQDGFSLQTGAGGASLAAAGFVADIMRARGISGGFASGGITAPLVAMLREGLMRAIFDVQCFDHEAIRSYREDPAHHAMSAALYASPVGKGAVVDRLDAMILGAAEVDLDYNVNVTAVGTRIIGGSGGHSDTAAGSRLSIVTTRLKSRHGPKLVRKVQCLTTPGSDIDVIVTDGGIAVNPARGDLVRALSEGGIDIVPIDALVAAAGGMDHAVPQPAGRIVAEVEARDGAIIDVIRGHDAPR